MTRMIQHEPLVVEQLETDQWTLPVHTHNYFELILIQAGSGDHLVNGNRFAYQAGAVFLLGPEDSHCFTIGQTTRFYCLSFTELYLVRLLATKTHSWLAIGEPAWRSHKSMSGSIVTNPAEQQKLMALAGIILAEQHSPGPLFTNPVVESLMSLILHLLTRQPAQHPARLTARQTAPSSLTQRMIAYVCRYISEPDYLRLEKMATIFNYSQSHLGALFKQEVGESIQQYIIRYKLKLVETRLSLSTMTISQIADEFGFSDVSHLNKLFKRYYHHTPTHYRRNVSS